MLTLYLRCKIYKEVTCASCKGFSSSFLSILCAFSVPPIFFFSEKNNKLISRLRNIFSSFQRSVANFSEDLLSKKHAQAVSVDV